LATGMSPFEHMLVRIRMHCDVSLRERYSGLSKSLNGEAAPVTLSQPPTYHVHDTEHQCEPCPLPSLPTWYGLINAAYYVPRTEIDMTVHLGVVVQVERMCMDALATSSISIEPCSTE
jgi:hypothetical protein